MALVSEEQDGEFFVSIFKHPQSISDAVAEFSPQEFYDIVRIGASAYNSLKDSIHQVQYAEMLAKEVQKKTELFSAERKKLEEELKQIRQKQEIETQTLSTSFRTTIQKLETDLQTATAQNTISESSLQKAKEQFDHLKKSTESMIHSSLQSLLKEKDESHSRELRENKEQHDKEIKRIQLANKESLETMERIAKEQVKEMRDLYEERETKLRQDLQKSIGSSDKGKQGEREFEDLVKEFVLWPPLVNMSKTSHGTDRSCKIRNCNTLFEIKNYSNDVPSKEVEKFERDMEEHQDAHMGVFVSLNTNIVSKKSGNFIILKWSSKSQLLLYINSFYKHSAEDILKFIDICADIAWLVFSKSQNSSDDETLELQSKIEHAKVYIESSLKQCGDLLTEFSHDKKFWQDQIIKQNTKYTIAIKNIKTNLQGMLGLLLGHVEDEPELEVKEEKEKPAKSKKGKAPSKAVAQST